MKVRSVQRIPIVDEARLPIGIRKAHDAPQDLLGGVESDERLLRDYVTDVGYQ